MERVPVASSAIARVGYEREVGILEVEFTSGRIYRYLGVPPQTHAALMEAESLGTYFGREIRNAGYPCERLR